jgi:predicted transcriptional regulator
MEIALTPERQAQLEEYARLHGKEPSEVAEDALARYLDYEEWFLRAVDEGIAEADRGEFIEHDDVRRMIDERFHE